MKITLQPPRRPLWRLVTNDGYLLSISASVASRGCLLIMPVKYMAWVLPILLILDLKTQLVKDFTCCIKKKDEHSIYVTSASKTTSMGSSQTSNTEPIPRYVLTYQASTFDVLLDWFVFRIPRSATFTERSAINSILSAGPMIKTKTWSGPLDDTLRKLMGDKNIDDHFQ